MNDCIRIDNTKYNNKVIMNKINWFVYNIIIIYLYHSNNKKSDIFLIFKLKKTIKFELYIYRTDCF